MARERKDGSVISAKISADILDRMDDFSEKTGITKTAIIENAVEEYLDREEEYLEERSRKKSRSRDYER